MKTQEQVQTTTPRRTDVQPNRLGMGWHFVWRYDPPIVHRSQREDRSSYEWEEEGETSEGCIMWLADEFARQELAGITAREIYRAAYMERDGSDFDDEWLATDSLRDARSVPHPIEYRDIGSDTTNDTVTVGNIGQLSGSRLKFDPAEADEGVYFVATAGGETKVPPTDVQTNEPAKVIFLIPATLVPGTYNIEVRARQGKPPSGPDTRELRIGRLDPVLTV